MTQSQYTECPKFSANLNCICLSRPQVYRKTERDGVGHREREIEKACDKEGERWRQRDIGNEE